MSPRKAWVRRVLDRVRSPAPAAPTSASLAANRGPRPAGGEPVLFVGQPRYFRSVYEDAIREGWGHAFEVRFGRKDLLQGLPERAAETGARTCVVFEPDMLGDRPEHAAALVERGVRLIAYSTEPLPRSLDASPHPDSLRRLSKIRKSLAVPFDLWIHHDPASEALLRAEGCQPLEIHPLPVARSLFFPEEVERDVDACFLGWSTPHREEFLERLEARFHVVHVAHGFFDEDARRLMNRSKVVINLHAFEFENFENRCVQALFCERPLVSEELSGGYLAPGVDYVLARTPREMSDLVGELLEREESAGLSPRFDRSRFLVPSLRALLERTRVKTASP